MPLITVAPGPAGGTRPPPHLAGQRQRTEPSPWASSTAPSPTPHGTHLYLRVEGLVSPGLLIVKLVLKGIYQMKHRILVHILERKKDISGNTLKSEYSVYGMVNSDVPVRCFWFSYETTEDTNNGGTGRGGLRELCTNLAAFL